MIDVSQWLELEKGLGPAGRLGVAARLHDANGQVRDESVFNADLPFPMASVVKVPIAMAIASRIHGGELSPEDTIRIDSSLRSPGMVRSQLDHLFFFPFEKVRTESVDRLLGFMLHYSDNTATDVLLRKVGGVPAVVAFLDDLGIREMHFKRAAGQLVAYYYGLQLQPNSGPRFHEILASIPRLLHPFTSRKAAEEALLRSGEDCCTPRAMSDLLTILATNPRYAIAFSHMERCAGGIERIRKGLANHMSSITTFAHKTGSLGGIANDVGVIKFTDGSFATICIMTCLSSVPMEVRDQQIAAATRTIMLAFEREAQTIAGLNHPQSPR
jgi:beta-lactamase class A